MKKRIFYSVFLSLLVLQLGGLVFFIKVLDIFFANETIAEMRYETKILSQYIDELIENPNPHSSHLDYHEDHPPLLLPPNDYRITIIDMSGKALFDNHEDIAISGDYSKHAEFLQAIAQNEGVSRPFSDFFKRKSLYYALLTQKNNGEKVVLRMSATQSSIFQVLFSLSPYLAIITCVFVVVSILIAQFIARSIVKPLRNIEPSHLGKGFIYPEFNPFLNKIKTQNKTIKSAIKRLRQKQQEFNALIANMNDGLLLLKPSGEIVVFNKKASELVGNLEDVNNIAEIEIQEIPRLIFHAFESKQTSDYQIQIREKHVEIIQSPIYIKNKLLGILMLLRDVTEKVAIDELKKEFMANVTHDLKTPITSIMVTSEMMCNGLIQPSDLEHFVKSIFDESKRLLAMVNKILEISRFETESQTSYPKSLINLATIAQRVVQRMRLIAQQKQIAITFSGESAEILGVEEMIENMLENLCDNAIKYSNPNTTIRLSLANEENQILLKVQDEGIGISAEDQQHVFERFFCVDKSRNKATNGIGLGLAIVKNIAHYHNATLRLDSELGKGTTFCFVFSKPKSAA